MGLRDLFLFVIVFSIIPFIFKRPYIGVLLCAWIGYMNPHRYGWGLAYSFPFVAVVASVTIISFVFSSEEKKNSKNIVVLLLFCFLFWTTITTFTSLNPEASTYEWKRFFKINILNFLALYLCQNRERINMLVGVIALSIGFYAIKGGIFTIATGGIYNVSGPANSFIAGNTEIGFASVVILPLIYYLWTIVESQKIKYCLMAGLIFGTLGVIGTHSRGAFLALGVLCIYFFLKSSRKFLVITIFACLLPLLFSFMPDQYFDRMETIQTYEEDNSALGRINAWWFAFNLANDRPILGGGFQSFTRSLFYQYAPEPENFHDAHSIYFEVLAEQGYPGLVIFLLLLYFSYLNCSYAVSRARGDPELVWVFDLGRMLQASFVAYAVGGAFLGLAYFDLLYHLFALSVLLRYCIEGKADTKPQQVTDQPVLQKSYSSQRII